MILFRLSLALPAPKTRYDDHALDVKARKPKRWLAIDDTIPWGAPREA